jgi:hypothetical protein
LEKLLEKCKILRKNERKTASFFGNLIKDLEINQEKLSKIPVITGKIYSELVPEITGMAVCHTANYRYLFRAFTTVWLLTAPSFYRQPPQS